MTPLAIALAIASPCNVSSPTSSLSINPTSTSTAGMVVFLSTQKLGCALTPRFSMAVRSIYSRLLIRLHHILRQIRKLWPRQNGPKRPAAETKPPARYPTVTRQTPQKRAQKKPRENSRDQCFQWQRGWDSNPRWLLTTLDFESSTFDHSDTSPCSLRTKILYHMLLAIVKISQAIKGNLYR